MATSLEDGAESGVSLIQLVPDELLSEVLRYLPTLSLKAARLTCCRWAHAGARWLFTRIFFRPHRGIMDVFTQITSNPVFARGITEMVYDSRLFREHMMAENLYFPAFDQQCRGIVDKRNTGGGSVANTRLPDEDVEETEDSNDQPEKIDEQTQRCRFASLKGYCRLYDEQEQILDDGEAFDVLSVGLLHLNNLKKVSIVGCFESSDCPWFATWSRNFWQGVVSPIMWFQCLGTIEDPIWKCRGIRTFIKAMSLQDRALTDWHFGSLETEEALELLTAGNTVAEFRTFTRSLKCLKLVCTCDDLMTQAHALAKIFDNQDLQCLSFGLWSQDQYELHIICSWEKYFSNTFWPRLAHLDISNWEFQVGSLKDLCYNCKDSLRELRIRYVSLKGPNKQILWQELAGELGQFLKLHYLYLVDLDRQRLGHNFTDLISNQEQRVLGFRIMQWIPSEMLLHCMGRRAVAMWHHERYIGRPGSTCFDPEDF